MTTRRPTPLIIVGDGPFAEIAFEYFSHDSPHTVKAFAVERAFRARNALLGLPVLDMETLTAIYPPREHSFFAAVSYADQNKLRERLYLTMKSAGFTPTSYVSTKAFVWRNVELGEHCFIFENNTIQPFVRIGENSILWSGNHIGHHSIIGPHSFFTSHAVLSGRCTVGHHCFFGVNATVRDGITIGDESQIGAGSLILADIPPRAKAIGLWKGDRPDA
jgi:sugar O-acyltransferase (sialic acid O-acetyltransferase NeuD family)